ncbi:MAG: SDR family oxidoreductase [Actinomycetota bacterium]|nr:SDR family oxidoreductase [Actinomycetota bacterium]
MVTQDAPEIHDRPLAGSVAVVTGAARAIGQEIAVTLAARGATVVSIDLAPATDTVSTIRAAGGEVVDLTADVADESSVQQAFDAIDGRFGRIDILVNNAGLFAGLERRPFWAIDAAEWDRVTTVNIRSVWLCTKAAAVSMRSEGAGRIVHLSSNTITFGMPNLLHYVASKAAVVGMTRSMAHELGPYGVTVNAVAPGLVTTEITKEWVSEDYRRQVAEGQCINSAILPADIANTVAFLCGPEARMITGQTILVNGGATMGPA